jgi:tripartite motif-containing protein 9/67
MLINRVANTDMTWHQEVTNAAPRVSPIIDLTLDDSHVIRAIDNLNFVQMKRKLIMSVEATEKCFFLFCVLFWHFLF